MIKRADICEQGFHYHRRCRQN